MSRKSIQVVLMAACFIFSISGMASGGIKYSKHDFSISSQDTGFGTNFGGANFELANTYPVEEICVFCHTPHNAAAPGAFLWNRTNTAATGYTLYTGSTLTMTAPTGLTLMCMSCHDGITSIAVGTLINAPYSPLGRSQVTLVGAYSKIGDLYKNDVVLPGWRANIGNLVPGVGGTVANLSDDHPVSFTWQDGILGIKDYATWSGTALKLFNNRMECSTCHDVHDNVNPPFLRMSNASSTMCTACHNK